MLSKDEVQWFCETCKDNAAPNATDESIANLNSKMDLLLSKMTSNFQSLTQALNAKADRSELDQVKGELLSDFDNLLSSKIDEKFDEMAERERRKLNITIGGLPETQCSNPETRKTSDLTAVKDALTTIGAACEIDNIRRVGKFTPNRPTPRLLIVKMKDNKSKGSALKNASHLKDHERTKNVNLRPDYTPTQQKMMKTLVDDLRAKQAEATARSENPKNWKIDYRRWKVVHQPPEQEGAVGHQ